MPNRIIKESICTSDSIDGLSWFEEVLFYRLIVNCDDYGRFDGRLAVIKSRLFGLKKKLSQKAIENGLQTLQQCGLVQCYNVEDKPYLAVTGWGEHQSVRNKRSKFPAPEDTCKQLQAIESNCMQLKSIEINCASHPIQSESESESKSESESESRERAETAGADFALFWSSYPRKVGKARAYKAFEKITEPVSVLLEALEKQKCWEQWKREDGRYIPNPERWLNNHCWEDELPISSVKRDGVIMSGNWDYMHQPELDAIRKLMEVD